MRSLQRSAVSACFLVQVDMHHKLNAIGLASVIPSSAWPPMNAVRELATKIKRISKGCECNLFVAVDLRK